MKAVINGISIAYDDRGSGPAVVLLALILIAAAAWYIFVRKP